MITYTVGSHFKRSLFFVFVLWSVLVSAADQVPRPQKHPEFAFQIFKKIPILSGGRIKPLDSFAREMVLLMTSARQYRGWEPVDLILSWLGTPQAWDQESFIYVGRIDVRRLLGLDEKKSLFSPRDLFENSYLIQYVEKMPQEQAPGTRANPRDQELRRVLERITAFRALVTGKSLTMIPDPKNQNPEHAWRPLDPRSEDGMTPIQPDAEGDQIRKKFGDVLQNYLAPNAAGFSQSSQALGDLIRASVSGWDSSRDAKISAEVFYHGYRPFQISWILYLVAVVVWVTGFAKNFLASKEGCGPWHMPAFSILVVGFLIHTAGILIRCYVAGRPPVTNMYETIYWVTYGVLIFSGTLYFLYRRPVTLVAACCLAALGLIAGDAAPAMMDPGIHPLVPVLRSNYWLTIHVLTITLGYAAFALTLGLGNVTLFLFMKLGRDRLKTSAIQIQQLNLLTYRAMQYGVVLLAAGTILGGVWADYSWGRFWGWDPKETWALIALLCYLAILHARFTNWVDSFWFAAWSVVGFLSVLMAWYGVNFVLGAGLHSYGFSSGGLPYILTFIAIQLLYVGFAWHRKGVVKP